MIIQIRVLDGEPIRLLIKRGAILWATAGDRVYWDAVQGTTKLPEEKDDQTIPVA